MRIKGTSSRLCQTLIVFVIKLYEVTLPKRQ